MAAATATGTECGNSDLTPDEPIEPAEGTSGPMDELQISQVHDFLDEKGRSAGGATGIAVIDADVGPVADRFSASRAPDAAFTPKQRERDPDYFLYTGSMYAGLIAGQPRGTEESERIVGAAPAARILSVAAFDAERGYEGSARLQEPSAGAIAAGLRFAAGRSDIQVVVVPGSISILRSDKAAQDDIIAAVEAVVAANKIVVVPTGSLLVDEDAPGPALAYPAEAAKKVKSPLLIVVNNAEEGDGNNVPSPHTDVAAPSVAALSYGVTNTLCQVAGPSPEAAAAIVAGSIALLRSAHPDDNTLQTAARLRATAAGPGVVKKETHSAATGYGIIQPYEGMSRILELGKKGQLGKGGKAPKPQPKEVAPPDPDLLEGTRDDVVWWGLAGSGALVIALLLRPVLGRRSR